MNAVEMVEVEAVLQRVSRGEADAQDANYLRLVIQKMATNKRAPLDIELHANVEHEIWSSWMIYMFSKGTINGDGSWTMPAWAVERWTRQMNMPYSELSEQERKSDREQVHKHNLVMGYLELEMAEKVNDA